MKLTDFALPGADDSKWLNADERKFSNDLLAQFDKLFRDRGVELTPGVMLRTWEVTTMAVVVRRLVRSLDEHGFHEADEGPVQEPDGPEASRKPASTGKVRPAVGLLSKVFECMRKAMNELESACNAMGTPIDKSEIEELAPLMMLTDDVLREAYGNDDEVIERARRRAHGYT